MKFPGPVAQETSRQHSISRAVLDELAARGLSAWFCLVGTQLQRDGGVELARRILDDGHRVVNHSLTHLTPLGDDSSTEHAHNEVVEMHDHTVMVLHDLPTGAMAHLPQFLDEVERRRITITSDLPADCVAMRSGRPMRDLAPLTSA